MPTPLSNTLRFRTHTVKPLASHTHTVIFLHDRGSDATEFALRLFDSHESSTRLSLRDTFPSFKWIFPYAPTSVPFPTAGSRAIPNDAMFAQWFNVIDVSHPQEGRDSQRESLDKGTAALLHLVQKEIREGGLLPNHIFLAGMGQGMAIAAHTLLRLDAPLAGLVGLNSWLPFQEEIQKIASSDDWDGTVTSVRALISEPGSSQTVPGSQQEQQSAGEPQLETAVFLSHSRDDSIVPFTNGTALRDTLSALGMKVEWHEYANGGHWFQIPQGVDDFAAFLRKSIARHYLLDKRLSMPVMPTDLVFPDEHDHLKVVA